MRKKLSLIFCVMYLCIMYLALCCAGCVSEAVNQSLGKMLKDPNALEKPATPDEPIFDPQSGKLIEHTQDQDITNRFENK